jgi:O-antigen/teichoic acid export membrane protein
MRWRTFMPLLRYSAPLIPVGAFQLGLHQADKLLIERLGPEEVVKIVDDVPLTGAMQWLGTYSFGYQIPFLLHVAAVGSFMRIWRPNVFAVRDDASRAPDVIRIGTLVLLAIALGQTIVAIFAREGVTLLAGDPSYYESARVVPWIAAGYTAYAGFSLGQAALMSVFATRTLAAINGIALAINLGLNLLWIPEFGIIGAASATVVSFTSLALMTAFAATRRKMQPFGWRVLPAAGVVIATATLLATEVDANFGAWSPAALSLKGIVALTAAFSLFWVIPPTLRSSILRSLRPRTAAAES